jgi:NRPS condensation-like uncharacterized protein
VTTDVATALDPGEQALWLLQRLEPDLGVSNVAVAVRSTRSWRWWPLTESLRWLLRRHPALCTAFPERDGVPVRERHDPDELELEVDVFPSTPDTLDEDMSRYAAGPFDLTAPPLIRVGQFNLPGGETALCLAAHHIVVDARSLVTLLRELDAAYQGIADHGEPPAAPPATAAGRPEPPER